LVVLESRSYPRDAPFSSKGEYKCYDINFYELKGWSNCDDLIGVLSVSGKILIEVYVILGFNLNFFYD
jgi:hypothetical protein